MAHQLFKRGLISHSARYRFYCLYSGEQAKFDPNKSPKMNQDGQKRRKVSKRVSECGTKLA